LIDTGCSDERMRKVQGLDAFRDPAELLGEISLRPSDITDIIVTHMHWDHVGDVGRYGNATVYVQREEFERAKSLVSPEKPHNQAVRLADVEALAEIERAGRLRILEGDGEIAPGLRVRLAGGHARGLQYVVVETAKERAVIASDNAYLYENVEAEIPPGLCAEPERAAEVLREMKATASARELVIPGHDPAVARVFEKLAEGVFRLG